MNDVNGHVLCIQAIRTKVASYMYNLPDIAS